MTVNGDHASSVLIVDDTEAYRLALGRSFGRLGWQVWLASDPAAARMVCSRHHPRLIVTELRLGHHWAFDFADQLRAASPGSTVVIVTVYPSVATAVQAVRLGFDGYLTKPVEAQQIVEATFGDPPRPAPSDDLPTLNRTIWEYLNQVFVAAGTMTEAARRLGIDRRSLRRMLARHPPAH
jgi:two-component system response regulator RegA